MREHEHANRILDMPSREKQKAYFRGLPIEIRRDVGDLVRIANCASQNIAIPGWRAEWIDKRSVE